MTKKLISVRLQKGTLEQIKQLQIQYLFHGFKVSQADIIQDAIHQMYKKNIIERDNNE